MGHTERLLTSRFLDGDRDAEGGADGGHRRAVVDACHRLLRVGILPAGQIEPDVRPNLHLAGWARAEILLRLLRKIFKSGEHYIFSSFKFATASVSLHPEAFTLASKNDGRNSSFNGCTTTGMSLTRS